MSFREKMAYVSLFALSVASLFYAGLLHQVHQQGGAIEGPRIIGLIVGMMVILIGTHIGGAIWAAVSNLEDAKEPADERDWQIEARAGHAAARAMAGWLAILIYAYFTGASTETLVLGMLMAFLLAGLAESGAKIYLYRHGL